MSDPRERARMALEEMERTAPDWGLVIVRLEGALAGAKRQPE